MSVQKIQGISVNGTGGQDGRPLFGAYIYSCSYQTRVGNEGTSSITLSLISESGAYSITQKDLNLQRVYSISIGNKISLQMYLKRYKLVTSARGRLLELEFIDGSFILDNLFVGLHNKHGCNPNSGTCPVEFGVDLSPMMIIVGREYNPCDTDFDGIVDSIPSQRDPCHHCNKDLDQDQQDRVKLVNCADLVKYDILPVKYNFGDLINGMLNKGLKLQNAVDPNFKCVADYTGTLREVLSSWCADFGWIFFWENNTITFKDLRTAINVDAVISDFCPNIEAREEEYTLEGTVQSNLITNYSRAGKNRDFNCQDGVYIQIPPYNKDNYPASSLKISELIDENAASLGYYAVELRQLYLWFDKYKMGNTDNIYPGKVVKELGVTILSNAFLLQGNTDSSGLQPSSGLDPSTSLDAPAFSKVSSFDDPTIDLDFMTAPLDTVDPIYTTARNAILSNTDFLNCFQLIPAEEQWKAAKDIFNKFFFIALWDSNVEGEFYRLEQEYANDFMGKYNIFLPNIFDEQQAEFFEDYTFIKDDTACNNQRKVKQDLKISITALDTHEDSVKYYNNTSLTEAGDLPSLGNMPFAKFLSIFLDNGDSTTSIQAVQDFKIVVVEKGVQGFYPTKAQINPDDAGVQKPRYDINNSKLIQQANSYYPFRLETRYDDRGEDMVRVLLQSNGQAPLDKDKNVMFLFMGSRVSDDAFSLGKAPSTNPDVKPGVPFNGVPLNPNDNPDPSLWHEVIYQYPQFRCLTVGNMDNVANAATFKTPVTNFNYYEPSYSNYGVVLQKERETVQKVLKVETVFAAGQLPGPTTLQTDIIYKPIQDEDIRMLAKQQNSSCIFDIDKIEDVHEAFAQNLTYSQINPLVKKSFTIAGLNINKTPSINDGLLSVDISIDDSGVKSTYTFGTTKMIPPKRLEAYTSALESKLNNQLVGYPGFVDIELGQ